MASTPLCYKKNQIHHWITDIGWLFIVAEDHQATGHRPEIHVNSAIKRTQQNEELCCKFGIILQFQIRLELNIFHRYLFLLCY